MNTRTQNIILFSIIGLLNTTGIALVLYAMVNLIKYFSGA